MYNKIPSKTIGWPNTIMLKSNRREKKTFKIQCLNSSRYHGI